MGEKQIQLISSSVYTKEQTMKMQSRWIRQESKQEDLQPLIAAEKPASIFWGKKTKAFLSPKFHGSAANRNASSSYSQGLLYMSLPKQLPAPDGIISHYNSTLLPIIMPFYDCTFTLSLVCACPWLMS